MTEVFAAVRPVREGLHRARIRSITALDASEARRAWNREHLGLVSELRCECTRPDCTEMVPAVAEAHRRMSGRSVVVPTHFLDGVVVRAADRFFIVELRRDAIRQRRRTSH